MTKQFLVVVATTVAFGAAGVGSALADVSINNPPAGTQCVGVTGGTTHAGTGGVSNSGTSVYFNGLDACH